MNNGLVNWLLWLWSLFLTLVFGEIPWLMAKKKTKNLDYLKEL